jgi:hypothetical protein
MPFSAMSANLPISVNRTYDRVWVEEIVISAADPNADATARVRLRLYSDSLLLGREFHPEAIDLSLDGLLAQAGADPDLDAAVTALMGYVRKLAIEQGIVADG